MMPGWWIIPSLIAGTCLWGLVIWQAIS